MIESNKWRPEIKNTVNDNVIFRAIYSCQISWRMKITVRYVTSVAPQKRENLSFRGFILWVYCILSFSGMLWKKEFDSSFLTDDFLFAICLLWLPKNNCFGSYLINILNILVWFLWPETHLFLELLWQCCLLVLLFLLFFVHIPVPLHIISKLTFIKVMGF